MAKNYHELTADPAAKSARPGGVAQAEPAEPKAQRASAKRMSAARVSPPSGRDAATEEIERKRAAACAEADDWRRRQLEAYLARKAGGLSTAEAIFSSPPSPHSLENLMEVAVVWCPRESIKGRP